MAAFLFVTFYASMAIAGLVVELVFDALSLTPQSRHAKVEMASVTWNYTTFLNIAALLVSAVLIWRFVRTGGIAMLKMMGEPMDEHEHHHHEHAHA